MIYEVGSGTGIYCIEGAGAHAYFIARPEPMLVDTGSPGQVETILRALAQIGVQPIHLKKIVLTHHHVGHVGNASILQRRSGARVCAHAADVPYINGQTKRRAARRSVERVFQSAVAWVGINEARPVQVDRRLVDGEELNGWRVIHTPGHTPGHICLLRQEILISGDLLLARAGAFREMPESSVTDLATARASIIYVAGMPFNAILPAHNPPHVVDARLKVQALAHRLGAATDWQTE